MQVFISYAKEDIDAAKRLYRSLNQINEISPWLDIENLLPGMDWEDEITQAIEESQFIILILSSKSVMKTGFFQKELRKAVDRLLNFPPGKIFIIPVRIDNCEPKHKELKRLQYVDMFPIWGNGILKIASGILKDPPTVLLDDVLSHYRAPRTREKWGFQPLSGFSDPVKYIKGNNDVNLTTFANTIRIIDVVTENSKGILNYSEKDFNDYPSEKHKRALIRDSIDVFIWEIAKDVINTKQTLFLENIEKFQDEVSEEFRKIILAKIGPRLLEIKDDQRSITRSVIHTALSALYTISDFYIEF